MRLIEHLKILGDMWAEANDRSLARLGTIVMKRGHFFDGLENGKDCNTEAFEKFLSFFRDTSNWRSGEIPSPAVTVLDQFTHIGRGDGASSGKADDVTAAAERAA